MKNKIKNFFKWLLRWIIYSLLIFLGFIYSLFKKENNPKIEKLKQEKKIEIQKAKKVDQKIQSTPPINPDSWIKNSIFKPTKENLKEEIIHFYCEEKRIKKYALTRFDEKIIEKLEEELIPLLEKEILAKHILTEESLQEEIKKQGKEELIKIEISQNPLPKEKNKEQKSEFILDKNQELFERKPSFIKETTPTEEKEITPTPSKERKRETPIFFTTPIIPQEKRKEQSKDDKQEILKEEKEPIMNNTDTAFSLSSSIEKASESPQEERKEIETIEEKKDEKQEKSEVQEEEKKKESSPKEKEKEEESLEKKEEFIAYNFLLLEENIKAIEQENKNLTNLDFEDKNYEEILFKIDLLLKQIEDSLKLNLKPDDKNKLLIKEKELKGIKNNIEKSKEKDIEQEKNELEENIKEEELLSLQKALQNLYLEHQIDLNEHMLNKAEDLENLSKEKLAKVEKELIKSRLKKASITLELPSILLLPFMRNRYFLLFTMGILINNHFNILDHLLKHQSVSYTPPELEHIKKGSDALENALNETRINLSYLNNLEQTILTKYPELSLDEEYLLYINKLRFKLLKNEEKMLKKKKMIQKYNLKYQIKIRKLKKKKIA